jgi:hypothetical protein
MKMREWAEELDAFLQFNDYEVLENKGTISRELALKLAEKNMRNFGRVRTRTMCLIVTR